MISFVLLLFILFAATPVVSALMIKMSVEDLTKDTDVIIIGNIKEVESRLNFWRTEVHTYSTVSVEKYIKGIGHGTLTIITEGGNAGDSGVWVEDTPVFTENEKVLVFLKKAGCEFRVAGWAQGKYIIENEEVLDRSGEKVSLNDFLRRFDDALQKGEIRLPDTVRVITVDAMAEEYPDASSSPAAQASPKAPGFGVIMVNQFAGCNDAEGKK